jgi:single-stranded DNA-binding protein
MAAINTFTIIGNVTKDIELRYTGSGRHLHRGRR